MTATTLTLADFILARVEEDENWATMAGHGCGYLHEHNGGWVEVEFPGEHNARPSYELGFIRRQSPARVLAECESKRAIVEQFRPGRIVLHDSTGVRAQTDEMDDPRGVDVLRALASVYADHSDFNPAWSTAAEFAVGK